MLNDRLLELSKIMNMTQVEFADLLGWSKQNAYHYFSGESKLRADHIILLKQKIPALNLNWLLLGKGEPIISIIDLAEECDPDYEIRQDVIKILEKQLNVLSKQLENAAAESAHHRIQVTSLTKIIDQLTHTDK